MLWVRLAAIVLATLDLAACAGLPHDGPSERTVVQGAQTGAEPYALVDLDYRVVAIAAAHPPRALTALASISSEAPTGLIGPSDTLSVSIFESGSGPSVGDTRAPGASTIALPSLTVDGSGAVTIPYAGSVRVAGMTPQQAEALIVRGLAGRFVNPQVIVQIIRNVSNSVTVIGEVRNPGRIPIVAGDDRLMEILSTAGGSSRAPADVVVTVVRGPKSASARLSSIMNDTAENVRLAARDQIQLAYRPRAFSTFGAVGHASQIQIETDSLMLAGALSRIGGLDAATANAQSVLVFRFERPEITEALGLTTHPANEGVPVIYRLNLKSPTGYFIANRFEVRADDVIYVPRSDSAELRQFFDLITSMTEIAYNIRVSGTVR